MKINMWEMEKLSPTVTLKKKLNFVAWIYRK